MQKTLGGDRLGSGSKMKVHLHNYERSTHDLGYLWRSTMAAGTLVPFMSEVALPGDTFDINLNCDIKTHPTTGPLFGSMKVQLDVFMAPIRLYNALLHNNMLGIGLDMSKVKLPVIRLTAAAQGGNSTPEDIDNAQINPSCLLSYLGLRGIGWNISNTVQTRDFQCVPILAYWDIYKNYYSNKQEEIGAVIHTEVLIVNKTVSTILIKGPSPDASPVELTLTAFQNNIICTTGTTIEMLYTPTAPDPQQVLVHTVEKGDVPISDIFYLSDVGGEFMGSFNASRYGPLHVTHYRYATDTDAGITGEPQIATFPLVDIDNMRTIILQKASLTEPFVINVTPIPLKPYLWLHQFSNVDGRAAILNTQEGLGLKTYQSDMFNNWLKTEWIDGPGGISEITAVSTASGSFTIDTLNLSKKVYDMLNRIAVSGGSYDDWLDAVYTHDRYQRCESPMYMGGLSKELVFQEVVSNSQTANEVQPLGTLAGKGVMSKKHKGGHVVCKVDEPSYIIGIVSITPRLDYSQGNKWDMQLKTMDDLHKPALDEIGFQELVTEQMAWWDTQLVETDGSWSLKSAGKQPAWINYMTNVNQIRGNFAISRNEMFMTLNRRYEAEFIDGMPAIKDLTTYIDPVKFNHIFAQFSLDAQNYWTQIAVDITARRKMSAKVMPNL